MTAMNSVGMGGPVGGVVMMNNGSPATPSNNSTQDGQKTRLNTYIYEYFLKLGHFDLARSLLRDEKFEIRTKPAIKQSPGRRKDGDVNGMDGDSMEMDLKDEIPDDLPRPSFSLDGAGNGFLYDWFCLFTDLFSAQRNNNVDNPARQYILQTQNQQRMREIQQNQNLPRTAMTNQYPALRNIRNPSMMNGDMQRGPKNMTHQHMQLQAQKMMQQQQQQQQQHLQQQPMQREPSDMEMNGRPTTPADGDSSGSPSKRPRLGDQQFNGGMVPNGRAPGMPPSQPLLMQTGFNPSSLNQAQFRQNGAIQQKAMQNQMVNGNMIGMPNSGSPMLQPMSDPQFANGMPMELYGQRMPGQAMQAGPGGLQAGPGGQGGNHALQDYQMQLMLLEQQNKKRLMMARQEQDNISQRGEGPPLPGQAGMQPPGLSPSGSRSGTSPNPTEQMKRGTPQIGGLPGSPAAGDAMQGRSPAGMFMNGMPQDFNAQMFMNKNEGMVGPGAPGMRPPTTMDMSNMARAQQGRMGGQFPGGQPMVQQPSQGQQQPLGTSGQREMPPPQAPAAANANSQRPQPASPPSSQAPPTPSQANKPNPKSKKSKEGDTRKRPNKKNSTVNAPTNEPEQPATPPSSTPITPVHPPLNNSAGKGNVAAIPPNPGPTSNPPVAPQPIPQPDLNPANSFSDFNLDFSTLENPDVLENFDFDSFLNTNAGDDAFGFDQSMGMDSAFTLDAPGE